MDDRITTLEAEVAHLNETVRVLVDERNAMQAYMSNALRDANIKISNIKAGARD